MSGEPAANTADGGGHSAGGVPAVVASADLGDEDFARWGIDRARLVAAIDSLVAAGEPGGPDALLQELRAYHPGADVELVRRAWRFAVEKHHGQVRKDGKPYVTHPIAVTQLLLRLRLDEASLCAGLLHDVVEDCGVSLGTLAQHFGADVAPIVDGVTKLEKIPRATAAKKQAENFRKMLVAMAQDIRVLLIKLADRLHNMSTLESMAPESQRRIAHETLDIYAPLANRLGIGWMKILLEDFSFRYLEPAAYDELRRAVGERRVEREAYVDRVVQLLRAELLAHELAEAEVQGRPKHLYGIWRKMQASEVEFSKIYDVTAFRIIVASQEHCYRALGVVHGRFTPLPGRFKDYIAIPKQNDYRSLHTTVLGPDNRPIEIQIRTEEMHRVAEMGVAAHWRYKERGQGISSRDEARFNWLKQLLELNRDASDPEEFLENVRTDLFADEIFPFTPAGDVKQLPRGATPVDFAYAIHTRIGETVIGAKVNGRIVPLNRTLRSGDIVEILTRPDAQPSKHWQSFVKTSRARTKIRNFIRAAEREQARLLGQSRLEKALRKHKISLARAERHDRLAATLEQFRQQSWEELLVAIGYGKTVAGAVVEHLFPEVRPPETAAPKAAPKRVRRRPAEESPIVVAGIANVAFSFARCCQPVPGDDVVGFVSRGHVTIHQRRCVKAQDNDPLRRVDVAWNKALGAPARVALRVETGNGPGMLERMSSRFGEAGVNIRGVQAKVIDDVHAVTTFTCEVQHRDQLERVMRALRQLDFVHRVERLGG